MQRPRMFDDDRTYLDRFGWVLFLSSLTVVALALVNQDAKTTAGLLASLIAITVVGMTLLIALRASGLRASWQRVADIVVVIAVLVNAAFLILEIFGVVAPSQVSADGRPATVAILAALTPLAVARRVLRHRRVTNSTLLGAIAVYMLIPLAFFYAFLAVDSVSGPFFGEPKPTTSFMYFSLTTVTTLGYGDLSAVTPFGRLLATSEAVLGQVYLVTFVAMLVGLRAQNRDDDQEARSTAGNPSDEDREGPT